MESSGSHGGEKRAKRSWVYDADMIRWIERKAAAERVSASIVVRRILRAAMDAELSSDEDTVQ